MSPGLQRGPHHHQGPSEPEAGGSESQGEVAMGQRPQGCAPELREGASSQGTWAPLAAGRGGHREAACDHFGFGPTRLSWDF